MRVVVIGGTGLIGRSVVRRLRAAHHDVLAASPTTGVNTVARIGLDAALTGAHAVVDVADAPSFDDEAVVDWFQTSAFNVAEAEARAGVGHHITLSVVGADRLPNSGYMRAKCAQEAVVRAAAVPFTILRSTQTFELLRSVADAATDHGTVRVSPALVRPIAATDVAEALATIVADRGSDMVDEVAGPEVLRLAEVVERMLRAYVDPRPVSAEWDQPYYGSVLDDATLMPRPGVRLGRARLDDYLRDALIGSERR